MRQSDMRILPAGNAANDESAAVDSGRRVPRLDEIIREIVRQEVRAELARSAASAPATLKYVSVAEYAAARSISTSTVRNAIRSGRLPALRFGAAVRVPTEVEIGKPIAAPANRSSSPATRAEQIVTARSTPARRSGKDEAAA